MKIDESENLYTPQKVVMKKKSRIIHKNTHDLIRQSEPKRTEQVEQDISLQQRLINNIKSRST